MSRDEKQEKQIQSHLDFMNHENSKQYRAKLKENYTKNLPTIPFLGQHLTDLTFTEDG